MIMKDSSREGKSDDQQNDKTLKCIIRETPQDCGLIPTIAVSFFLGWFFFLVFFGSYFLFFATKGQRTAFIIVCSISVFMPRKYFAEIGFPFGDWIMRESAKYFGLKVTIEKNEKNEKKGEEVDSTNSKPCIFCLEPHDILPFSAMAFSPALSQIPGHNNCVSMVTSAIFSIPFLRQVFTWIHCYPASKEFFIKKLRDDKTSLVFNASGVRGVTYMDPKKPDDVTLFLRNRKGFIKIALETQSPIVPAFCFNLIGSYNFWLPKKNALFMRISRKIGFAPLIFWGRWNIIMGIPRPRKLSVVIGNPIEVPSEKIEITPELIDEYHARFIDELEKLFERHKHEVGYENKNLNIL